MKSKPEIIVLSSDTDDAFKWLSNGWFTVKQQHTKRAQELMEKANRAIDEGKDVPDVIERLKKAGFEIRRSQT